jgi:uncharacterized protein YigA (DUF484 family)
MSQREQGETASQVLTEDVIASYLGSHPDFFDRHPRLLTELEIAHEPGGTAISLVERQVGLLRQKSADLEKQLKQLVSVAKANDALVEKIHHLSLRLMAASDFSVRLDLLESGLREDFRAERAVLVLFEGIAGIRAQDNAFVKFVERNDPALKPFATFLKMGKPRSGLIRDRQKSFLFAGHETEIGSAALVPLGCSADLGFLVIGSSDRDYFNPGKSMDLLTRLGELVAVALTGQARPSDEPGRREREL